MTVENNDHITAIIPIGTSDFSFYEPRLALRDAYDLSGVTTLIVDDASSEEAGAQIREFCEKRGYIYCKTPATNTGFSSPRARNFGIQAAATQWISLEDADVIYEPDFYAKALAGLSRLEDDSPFSFLNVPTVYFTKEYSEGIFEHGLQKSDIQTVRSAITIENPRGSEGNKVVLHFAPASGIFLLKRKTALLAGGYDEQFVGWGGEDRDFAFRLLALPQACELPVEFGKTKPWNLNDTVVYEGWRSLYRINGDYAANLGLLGYHLHHAPMEWRGPGGKQNIEFARAKAEHIAKSKKLNPAQDKSIPPDIILGRNPHLHNFQVLKALPNPLVIDEAPSVDAGHFAACLLEHHPSSIYLWNPYGTEWRLSVYRALRERNAPLVVAERGALPRSFYFDRGGLSVESDSYSERNWDVPISAEESAAAELYMSELRFGTDALETQNPRVGSGMLRLKLGVQPNTKLLVVPLQLFDDTVTTYFSEIGRGYSEYIVELRKLALQLPSDWVLVYKNHPLAREKWSIEGAVACDDAHINDLLEVANAVAVFNSGTGLMAMAFGKPVFVYGRTFYGVEGVNRTFVDADQMVGELSAPFEVDMKKVRKFFHYLTTRFYSFADVKNSVKKQTEHSNRVVLESLHYTEIALPGQPVVRETRRWFDIKSSVLFDRYRNQDYISRTGGPTLQKLPPPAPPKLHSAPVPKSLPVGDIQIQAAQAAAEGNFARASDLYKQAYNLDKHPTHLRVAAELLDRTGRHEDAVTTLELAHQAAKSKGGIKRRISELRRPAWLRRVLPERPFPIPKA